MLRYLTYKLKTQSLNEADSFPSKNDDDHDSGTESDDEGADAEELEKYMDDSLQGDVSSAPSDRASSTLDTITDGRASSTTLPDSALPSDTDCQAPPPPPPPPPRDAASHSSEEELEVIIGRLHPDNKKRKWSQANHRRRQRRSSSAEAGASSDDDEVRDLMCASAPVEFRASPPADVPRPSRSLSPPPKLFHLAEEVEAAANIPPHELCVSSPRKRHRRHLLTAAASANLVLHRPCLDFEKMQQVFIRK